MTFVILTIILGAIPGIIGALLASRYSAFALIPVALVFLAVTVAACLVHGASLSASALAVWLALSCLHVGYFLRLFVPQAQRPGATSRAQHDTPPQRAFGGQRRDVLPSSPRRVDSRLQDFGVSALETSEPDDFEVKNKRPIVDIP